MSIESVQQRIADVQAMVSSITSKANTMFSSILQEKIGNGSTTAASSDSDTVQQDENTATYESTLIPMPASAVSGNAANAYNYNTTANANMMAANNVSSAYANSAYCAVCAANGATHQQSATAANYNATLAQSGLSERDIQKASPYMEYVYEANQRYGMPVNLILGIMKAESDFNNECVSYAGAKGLMQLMPETAAEVGVTNEFDPRQNILGSVEYVTKLINRYDGDVRLALAAYNTGPGKIARRGVTSSTSAEYLTVPQSIRDYADRVLRYAGYQN